MTENSILNNYEKLVEIVNNNYTYSDVLRAFHLKITGGNQRTLKRYIQLFNINTEHFNSFHYLINKKYQYKVTNEELFTKNSSFSTEMVKDRIIKYQLIKYQCARTLCKNKGFWNGEPLTLQLEHINGDNTDHQLSNLEFLCPNCHTQTKTYGSKNKKKYQNNIKKEKNMPLLDSLLKDIIRNIENNNIKSLNDIYLLYNISFSSAKNRYLLNKLEQQNSIIIRSFLTHIKKTKIQYPEPLLLLKMVQNKNFVQVAKELGCSDNAVRKHLKKHGLLD